MEHSTVSSLLRSTQAFCGELCEKETLDFGIAYYSTRFAALPEANQFREVWIEDPTQITVAFEQAEHFFAEKSLSCHRWAPAGGHGPLNPGSAGSCASEQLSGFLEARGFRRRNLAALALSQWHAFSETPKVRVLPARAMRAAFQKTFVEATVPKDPALRQSLSEAYLERLDDPQLDMFVATVDGKPAGRAALYQVGDFARIIDLAVLSGFEAAGTQDALLSHVIGMARRLEFRRVLMQVEADDRQRIESLERIGFVRDGAFVEFERDAPTEPRPS